MTRDPYASAMLAKEGSETLAPLLAPNVQFDSAALHRPFAGKDAVLRLLPVLRGCFDDVEITDEFTADLSLSFVFSGRTTTWSSPSRTRCGSPSTRPWRHDDDDREHARAPIRPARHRRDRTGLGHPVEHEPQRGLSNRASRCAIFAVEFERRVAALERGLICSSPPSRSVGPGTETKTRETTFSPKRYPR